MPGSIQRTSNTEACERTRLRQRQDQAQVGIAHLLRFDEPEFRLDQGESRGEHEREGQQDFPGEDPDGAGRF